MTTAESAALLAAGAFLALTVVLSIVFAWAVVRMRREAESLRTARVEAEALINELGTAVARAHAAATRLDGAARRPGTGSALAYETLSGPVVKGLALASGIGQAARSMRSK